MSLAFLMPGQGSQAVGMGKAHLQVYPQIAAMFDCASDKMNEDITTIALRGPNKTLQSTRIAQVAIFTLSVGVGQVLQQRGVQAQVAAGHSLGAFSALCLAGVADFEPMLDLVIARATAMQTANLANDGTMSAVSGCEIDAIAQAISDRQNVWIANHNAPNQTIISGTKEAVAAVSAELRAIKARCMPLAVAGAYHSGLMASASLEFARAVDAFDFCAPLFPVMSNVTGEALTQANEIGPDLKAQITQPVFWRQSLAAMVDHGVDLFVEIGASKQMKGLALQNHRDIPCFTTANPTEIDSVCAKLAGVPV